MNCKKIFILCWLGLLAICAKAQVNDTIQHWGYQISVNPAWIPTMDHEINDMLINNGVTTFGFQARRLDLPHDQDPYAHDFRYPVFAFGLNYNQYNHVKMHREDGENLGMGKAVDYHSTLGNSLSLYVSFEQPFVRRKHWELDYAFNMGMGYSHLKYDKDKQVDNLMISSNFLIYFGAGLHATYYFLPEWGVKAGVDFHHHSSGTLKRPNKGSNTIGPMIGLVYAPYYKFLLDKDRYKPETWNEKQKYINLTVDVGLKTLYEDWVETQYKRQPSDPDYRTNDFKYYTVYAIQADYMYRYARKWASGFGLDLYYYSYMDHVKKIDKKNGYDISHSPFSVGLSAKHEVFYHNLALSMSVGAYLFRQHGHKAGDVEQPFYETIGLKYHLPKCGGLALGAFVRAHALKADHTGLSVSYPINL